MVRAFFLVLLLLAAPLPAEEEKRVETEYFQEENTPAPEKQTPLDSKNLLIKTVLLLAGLIGLLYGGAFLIRRMSGGRFTSSPTEGDIRLIERKYLSPKTAVWLVEVRGLPVIVVDGQNGVSALPINPQPTEKPLV